MTLADTNCIILQRHLQNKVGNIGFLCSQNDGGVLIRIASCCHRSHSFLRGLVFCSTMQDEIAGDMHFGYNDSPGNPIVISLKDS